MTPNPLEPRVPYQDFTCNGRIVCGPRECAGRYELLRPILDQFNRRFTVLDIGAHMGYFGTRIAQDYDAVVVMADYEGALVEQCKAIHPKRTIALHRTLTVDDLRDLADCEHFDVVLALNVLHHWEDWRAAADAVLRIGEHTIIETPGAEDIHACNCHQTPELLKYVKRQGVDRVLGLSPSHTSDLPRPMLYRYRPKRHQRRPFIVPPERVADLPAEFYVESDSDSKTLYYRGTRPWIHGINLWTYWNLGGAYPDKDYIIRKLERFPMPLERHGDIRPWNFIFDGEELHLIDGRDERANFDDTEGLQETIRIMREMRQ